MSDWHQLQFKWLGCQLILIAIWFPVCLSIASSDSSDLDVEWFEIQVVWLSSDLRFQWFGCQLIWNSNDLVVNWSEIQVAGLSTEVKWLEIHWFWFGFQNSFEIQVMRLSTDRKFNWLGCRVASDQTCTSQRDRLCFATVSRYTSQNGSSKTGHPGLEVMRGGHTEVVARPSVLLTIAQPELKTCQPGYNRYSSQTCTCQRDQIVSRRWVETHRKTNLKNLSARVQQLVIKRARASETDCVSRRSVDTHRKADPRKRVTQGWKMLEVVRGGHTEVVARPSVLRLSRNRN